MSKQVVFYEIIGSTVTPITPITDEPSPGARWDSTVFGVNAILTNGSGAPFARGVGSSGPIERMPNWPAGWSADMIRTYRNFLVALRVTKDGYYDETRVQWSNASPNNSLPPDWDELDPASLAGGTSLAGDTGPILDAAALGQSLLIYTQKAVWVMALGGATVMTIRPALNMGLLSRGCVIPFDTFHFCVGNGSIFVHDGSSVKYPADDITNTDFYRDLADPNDVRLAHDEARRTVEIFYKSDADLALPNRVLRWNYKNNTWTFNDYDAVGLVRAKFAPDSQRIVAWNTIDVDLGDGSEVAWADLGVSWTNLGAQEGRLSFKLLVRSGDESVIMRREPVAFRDGQPFVSIAEREFIDFDEMEIGGKRDGIESVKHINKVLPQVRGSGVLYFQFGTAMTPGGSTEWGPIVPYDIETDRKVDFRASGRYFAWRVYNDTANPVTFRLSGFDLDVSAAGSR